MQQAVVDSNQGGRVAAAEVDRHVEARHGYGNIAETVHRVDGSEIDPALGPCVDLEIGDSVCSVAVSLDGQIVCRAADQAVVAAPPISV